jgi:hypothetical protein
MAKKDYGSSPYNGKLVPLTSEGLFNKVYLKKEDRQLVDDAKAKLKGIAKENRQAELKKFLDGLSK